MSTNEALSPEVRFLIDFNIQNVPAILGLAVPDAAAAAMFDVPATALAAYVRMAEAKVQATARALLTRAELSASLASWPLSKGGTVLAIGDSITTYRYSYARLLAAMLDLERREDQIRFVNVGQSGYTSSQGLETTYTQCLAYEPDWVLIKFGVNDAKQFGGADARTLVTCNEYRANISAIVDAFDRFSAARIVLLTPTPVVEAITNSYPDFAAMRLRWRNANLTMFADEVRTLARARGLPYVDLLATFGLDPDPAYYLPDGLHPNEEGHRLIVAEVLKVVGD